MEKDIKNIVYINTLYSLFLILLKEPNFNENFYFFDEKISKDITKKFKNKIELYSYREEKNKIISYLKIRKLLKSILKNYKDIFEGKTFYLNDSLEYSQFFLNNFKNNFFLIEDGTINYNEKQLIKELEKTAKPMKYHTRLRKKYIYFSYKRFSPFGLSEKIKKIYLTGALPIPNMIEKKVEKLDIINLWRNLTEKQKKEILEIFNLKIEELKKLLKEEEKVLLITQPLSEDGIISEEEKLKIYKEILEERKIKNICIKPHPREKTNYKEGLKEFNIQIIDKKFPIEIIMLFNINFKSIITLFSTAALNFKDKYNVEFIGTEQYKKLYERFGKI